MIFRIRMAVWGAAIAGITFVLFGTFVCFRSLERYYYAYGPATDDLNMRHIKATLEIEAWAATAVFIIFGLILLRLAKTLRRLN
jgi:hypothetical protein